MMPDFKLLMRRTFASLLDTSIEMSGGVLGSYFGMMVAALLESAKDGPPEQLQSSMWSGFGFGFLFWTISISFINRVLIQGLSRATIGKKFYKLELVSTASPLSWTTVFNRWIMGFGSFALGGSGFIYAFFDKEGRTFHDLAAHTHVVGVMKTSMVVAATPVAAAPVVADVRRPIDEEALKVFDFPNFASKVSNVVVLPTATAKRSVASSVNVIDPAVQSATLAQVIQIHAPDEEDDTGSQAA